VIGTTLQRNDGLAKVKPGTAYVAFFDDDMEFKDDYLEKALAFLDGCPTIAGICGKLLVSGGVSREQAREMIADYKPVEGFEGIFDRHEGAAILYGCCMLVRFSLLQYEKFDENLPLYGYAEDYDISVRLRRYGIIGRYRGSIGVHLKSPEGRVNEIQRGYAIMANCWYLLKKEVCHLPPALGLLRFWIIGFVREQFFIFLRIVKGDRSLNWIDQSRGCLIAVVDILRGRSSPQRMLDISKPR
jgi:GT2 family glycosyltransferase